MKITPDRTGENQKIIGVVGVAPWSTLDFLDILYKQFKVDKDWHYPRIICDINTKIPSRGRHFELGEEDFSPYIQQSIENLKAQGAEVIVVTCNTAHIHFDKWCHVDGVDVLHIVDECSAALKNIPGQTGRCSPETAYRKPQTAVIFSGYSLWKTGLYQKKLLSNGLNVLDLSDQEANLINLLIMDIKQNGCLIDLHLKRDLDDLLRKLKDNGVDSLVLGCTELTRIREAAQGYIGNVIDSNLALAQAAIRHSKNGI